MNRHQLSSSSNQRGFSLAEILVATAIFAIIMIAALMIYDQSQQVFKSGVETADTTQNVRVAFDQLVQDLRMAGFDHDRDGIPTGSAGTTWEAETFYNVGTIVNPTVANGLSYRVTVAGDSSDTEPNPWPTEPGDEIVDGGVTWETLEGTNQYQQPDEQIEYIGPHAIAVRGNFDYETDADNEHGRETDLESGMFPVVTTNNDEIVLYALESDVDANNGDSVTFHADLSIPRDAFPNGGGEEPITVAGLDLSMENPPYTLYRITFDANGVEQRAPLASNIRSLDFSYFQDSAGLVTVKDLDDADVSRGDDSLGGINVLGEGPYDTDNPTAVVAERIVRARVRAIRVTLIGMNAVEDPTYVDPYETVDAFKHYRKYRLESMVSPRNVGRRGMREQDTNEPGAPVITKICFGHCGIAYLEWQAPEVSAVQGAVEQYAVVYDTDISDGGFANIIQVGQLTQAYVYGLSPTEEYFFKVQAINSFGTTASIDTVQGTPKNATKPMPPQDVTLDVTATAGTNSIVLTWTRPTANEDGVNTIACSDGESPIAQMPAGEIKTYRVWRSSTNPDFDPADGLSDEIQVTGTYTTNSATGAVSYTDDDAAACVTYYYRVQVVDNCEDDAAKNETDITGISDYYPAIGDPAVSGINDTATTAPAAPGDLMIPNTYTCTTDGLGNEICDVTLTWPKVTADTADPVAAITVDKYIVRRQAMKGGVNVGDPEDFVAEGASQISGSTMTYTNEDVPKTDPSDGEPYSYKYTVVAVQCDIESEPSPERLWPCTFAGGDIDAILDPLPYDGSGLSSGSPWLTTLPASLTVSTTNSVQQVRIIMYDMAGDVVAEYTQIGPLSTAEFTLDSTSDGDTYHLSIAVTDELGCTNYLTRYVEDSPQACCLSPNSFDATVLTHGSVSFFSDITLKNICDDDLVISSVAVKWAATKLTDVGAGQKRIQTMIFDQSGSTPVTVTFGNSINTNPIITGTYPGGGNATVAAGSSNYKLRVSFNRVEKTFTVSPIVAVCVNYWRDKDGDGIVDTDENESCTVVVDDATMSCP